MSDNAKPNLEDSKTDRCPRCSGSGSILTHNGVHWEKTNCPVCGGKKYVKKEKAV